jgi:hypothetical protein
MKESAFATVAPSAPRLLMPEEAAMGRKLSRRLKVINANCAGIDLGGSRHFVAVDPECSDEPVRNFGCFTDELENLGQRLHEFGVTVVAMESTGVYWSPSYQVLERMGFEVHRQWLRWRSIDTVAAPSESRIVISNGHSVSKAKYRMVARLGLAS